MTQELLQQELAVVLPLYRVLLIPLGSDAESRMVENTIVNQLCQHPVAAQFLCNKRTHTYSRDAELEFVEGSPRIVGLTI
jgi:hypothetical protein